MNAKGNTKLQQKLIGTDQQKVVRRERLKISYETKVSRALIQHIAHLSPDEILTEYYGKEYGWYKRTFDVEEEFLEDKFVRLNSLGMV